MNEMSVNFHQATLYFLNSIVFLNEFTKQAQWQAYVGPILYMILYCTVYIALLRRTEGCYVAYVRRGHYCLRLKVNPQSSMSNNQLQIRLIGFLLILEGLFGSNHKPVINGNSIEVWFFVPVIVGIRQAHNMSVNMPNIGLAVLLLTTCTIFYCPSRGK